MMGRRWHRRPKVLLTETVLALSAVVFLVAVASAVHEIFADGIWGGIENRCEDTETACGAAFGSGATFLMLGFATAAFVFWRIATVRRPLQRRAKHRAREFVPTAANSILDQVVGRDELCDVVSEELRHRKTRRPHLLVGDVGAGKTAVLVRLTELLAQRGAIPVPIRLRDVGDELDFGELARERFCKVVDAETIQHGFTAAAVSQSTWRWLRKEDRVVVLADGLEEVLAGKPREADRDNQVRRAIRNADRDGLPLVIASRPHAALRAVEAATTDLEPLSEEAALDYIERGTPAEDEHRLDWIVERADVTEAPIYLQIASQLYHAGRLERVFSAGEAHRLDTRDADRAGLRLRLLETWVEALIDGHFSESLALRKADRRAAVEQISALACIGLQRGTIEVPLDHLIDQGAKFQYPELLKALTSRLRDVPDYHEPFINLPLAATWGEQMRLVEAHGDHIRFQHSIMQAYLGSRYLAAAWKDDRFFADALGPHIEVKDGELNRNSAGNVMQGPAREFLMAMAFWSRAKPPEEDSPEVRAARSMRKQFLERAVPGRGSASAAPADVDALPAEKRLDFCAAALEVSCGDWHQHARITQKLADRWRDFRSFDSQGLEASKIHLVSRLGEPLHEPTESRGGARNQSPHRPDDLQMMKSTYRLLFNLGCGERSYAVRLAIIEQIGNGGDIAFQELGQTLDPKSTVEELRQSLDPNATVEVRNKSDECDTRATMSARIAPLLAGSVQNEEMREAAKNLIEGYVREIRSRNLDSQTESMIRLEIALAQGFKAAANRRIGHLATSSEGRMFLAHQAEELLKCTTFWFAQLTIIQALTLWRLPDVIPGVDVTDPYRPTWQNRSPRSLIDRWLALAGSDVRPRAATAGSPGPSRSKVGDWPSAGPVRRWQARRRIHPFVRCAGELAVETLRSEHPERYLWIDETDVVNKIGSVRTSPARRRIHNLWIPPSTGWTALDPRAQQLVADVLLLMHLVERGTGHQRENHLRRANRVDLPPCLIADRRPMQPDLSIARPGPVDIGSTCMGGCPFELCPYPPRGELRRRELGEALCRRQETMVSQWDHRKWFGRLSLLSRQAAPWQRARVRDVIGRRARLRDTTLGDLRAFWRLMANRRRVQRPDISNF